jgi:hypothetical protein
VPLAAATVKFEVVDPSPSTALVGGSPDFADIAWRMTNVGGNATVHVQVGSVETVIRTTLVPPMAPQNVSPYLPPAQDGVPAGQVIAHVHVEPEP